MADFGTEALGATPTQTGLIGKIARTVIEGERIPNLFAGVHKGTLKYGKYLELQLRKAATGYLAKGAVEQLHDDATLPVETEDIAGNSSGNYKSTETLYFKEWIKKTYSTVIDYDDIDEGSQDEATAARQAGEIVDALYQGATKDANAYAFMNLAAAIATAATSDKKITNVGSVAEITDYETANEWLALVKKIAKKVRRGSGAVNVDASAEVPASRVIMVTPADNITGVDVYKRAPSPDNDFTRFDVDEVIEYDPDRYTEMNGATIIADERYFQFYNKAKNYRESEAPLQGAAGGDAVLCTLSTRDMYALCPLFNAAVISQT